MKRRYNNLFDSIAVTVLLCVLTGNCVICNLGFYVQSSPITAVILVNALFFLPLLTANVGLIVWGCYGYWFVADGFLVSGKLFGKRKRIELEKAADCCKKTVSALVLGLYKSEAYVITGDDGTQITVLLNEKNSDFIHDNLISRIGV